MAKQNSQIVFRGVWPWLCRVNNNAITYYTFKHVCVYKYNQREYISEGSFGVAKIPYG